MAQINQWDGGLNIRQHPGIIGINEGTTYINVDNGRVSLSPIKHDDVIEEASGANLYIFKDMFIYSNDTRDYVEFNQKLYYSDGVGRPQKSYDGTTFYNLGIDKPTTAVTIASNGSGNISGTLQYCYTYYNVNDGTESQPSAYSSELVVSNNKVLVSNILASTDPQVTHIRLYRLGGTLEDMFLVVELSNADQSYEDNIGDLDILGYALDSHNNAPAFTGTKYLTEANAMIFGAIDNKLYYTDVGFPDYWSEFNYIVFDDTITGLGQTQSGLIVFTMFKAYIIVGTSPTTLSKYLLSGNQGCLNHKTIRFVNNTLIWVSTDGICASSGGDIQVITKNKLGIIKFNDIKDSIVYNEVYYLSANNKVVALDFRYTTNVRELDIYPSSFMYYKDLLYFVDGSYVYTLGTNGFNKNLKYKSGNISDGSLTIIKTYKSFYAYSTGNLTITIYIDDALVSITQLLGGVEEIKIPNQYRQGYNFSYKVEGSGELFELEYKVEGRQNGR